MSLLNYIAGLYDMNAYNGSAIDVVAAFNAKFGTTYTGADLRSTYLKEFTEFMVSLIKQISDALENRSKKFHWSPAKQVAGVNYTLLRHTPKDKQKLILHKPLLYDAEAMVMPEIFNDNYLKLDNYEGVMFWQNENDPAAIDVTPAIPDVSDPTEQTAGSRVQLEYIVGVLFDEDALLTDFQLDEAYSTPVEARKRYRNIWWHFAKNAINDFTENGVLFYMGS